MVPKRVAEAIAVAARVGFGQSCAPEVGRLLSVLAACVPSGGRILEIGTGAGVGTAWIVDGIGASTTVSLVSVDNDEELSRLVAGGDWPTWVQFEVADALQVLPALGLFDLVFADAAAGKWHGLDRTVEATKPGGLIVVDDMTPPQWADEEHEARTRDVRARLLDDPRLSAVEITWGSGLILACRRIP